MQRRIGLLSCVLALAVALPASAQVKQRDHRKKHRPTEVVKAKRGKKGTDPIKVTGWAPHSGPVGTEVRIDGKGFDKKTLLLIGGKRVKPRKLGRNAMIFVVPRRWGDGQIVLRHPNQAQDVVVGTFEVIEDPYVRAFSPATGVGGTRIEITGTGFRKGDQVTMNKRAIGIVSIAANRIVATIPADASTDYVTVSRTGGASARSRTQFRVVEPAPVITSMKPASGARGTTVRLAGQHFPRGASAHYGRQRMQVAGVADSWIDVVIPDDARGDQYIEVRSRWGKALSPQRFELERPAVVSRFSPSYGVVGDRVEIYGDNFAAGDIVTLNGKRLKMLQLRPRQISVEIPVGGTTGAFVVERGNTRVTASGTFEVVYAPSITGFAPSGGAPGTRVSITGAHFTDDADLYFGRQRLRIISRSDAAIVAEIPRRARDQFFIVKSKGGQATSQTQFQVHTYSDVTGLSPSQGPAGTKVVIRGKNFGRRDRFYMGKTELPIEERSPVKVIVSIPNGAQSGRIAWESWGRRSESRYAFTVVYPPTWGGYTPHSGPGGTLITIKGDNFARTTKVLYGNREIRVVKWNAREIVAEIPKNASGTKYIWVVDAGARVRSGKPFEVLSPPSIASFAPVSGTPGTEVTIAGSNFTKATTVRLGRTELAVSRWSPTNLTVTIPANASAGKDYFWVSEDKLTQRAPTPFRVTDWATITSFRPARAKPGQRIMVKGENFTSQSKVQYGKYDCEVTKVHPSGKWVQIVLASEANGKGYLWVDDQGHRSQSPQQLEVIGNKRPTEVVPSRRGKKKKKRDY